MTCRINASASASALVLVSILVLPISLGSQLVQSAFNHNPQHRLTVRVLDGWSINTPGAHALLNQGKNAVTVNLSETSSTAASRVALQSVAPASGVQRPGLGVETIAVAPWLAREIGLAADSGLLIQRVVPGSAAEQAGLHGGTQTAQAGNALIVLGGDLLVGLDDERIETQQDLIRILSQHRVGDRVTIAIYRGKQKMQVPVTLGEVPSAGAGAAVVVSQLPASSGSRISPDQLSWGHVNALDQTFGADLPQDWRVARAATWCDFRAFSPRGEFVRAGKWDIFPDRQSMLAMAQLLQQLSASGAQQAMATIGLSPEDVALSLRAVLPPLSPPADVIGRLLPQLANGAIQNMRILEVRNIPMLLLQDAFGGALISYQYTLIPPRGDVFASLVAPALMNNSRVPMHGLAIIYTLPPSGAPLGGNLAALNRWSCLHLAIEAPQALFSGSTLVYDRIFENYAVNTAAVAQQGAAWMQMLNAMHQATEESGHRFWLALGGLQEFSTASDSRLRIMERKDCQSQYLLLCPRDSQPQCYGKPPAGLGCVTPIIRAP